MRRSEQRITSAADRFQNGSLGGGGGSGALALAALLLADALGLCARLRLGRLVSRDERLELLGAQHVHTRAPHARRYLHAAH